MMSDDKYVKKSLVSLGHSAYNDKSRMSAPFIPVPSTVTNEVPVSIIRKLESRQTGVKVQKSGTR